MNLLDKKLIASLTSLLLAACSGGDDTPTGDIDAGNAAVKTLTGSVVKGPIDGATLTLRPINPFTGFIDEGEEPLASATTDAEGNFTFEVEGLTGPGVLQTSGGRFVDESDANFDGGERRSVELTEDQGFTVYIPSDVTVVSVTMLTEIMVRRAEKLAETSNSSLGNAFDAVRVLTLQALGYDPLGTLAVNPLNPGTNATLIEKQYALAIGGLAYVSHEVAIRAGLSQMTPEVINAVIVDLSDGRLDGQEGSEAIIVNDTEMADVDLASAIKRFRSNNDSQYQGITPSIPNEEILQGEPEFFNSQPQAEVLSEANLTVSVGESLNLNALLSLSDEETIASELKLAIAEPPFIGVVTGDNGEVALGPNDPPQSTLNYTIQETVSQSEIPLDLLVTDNDLGASRFQLLLLVNNPPEPQPDSFFIDENAGPQTLDVLANDSDFDGDTLSIVDVSNVVGGSAQLILGSDPNQIRFTADEGFTGLASFDYQVSDGNASATASVEINVSSTNTPPTAASDTATAEESQAVQIDVLGNDSDPDGDSLTVIEVTQPANGSVTIDTGGLSVTYVSNNGFTGEDQFSYTISDGREGGTASSVVDVFVTAANTPPVAQDDSESTPAGQPVPVFVLDNDSDADGDILTVTNVSEPTNGTAVIEQGGEVVTYTPAEGFAGEDQFTYTVSDGRPNGAVTANVTITVIANTPPSAQSDQATTSQDTPVTINVLANDSDEDGDSLLVVEVSNGENGIVGIDQEQTSVTYTPNTGFFGEDNFTYTVDDGAGGQAVGSVSVTVTSANDAPVATSDSARTRPDQPVQLFPLKNDSDANHDRLFLNGVTEPSNGSVSIDGFGSQLTYTPNSGFEGSDTFDYTVSDGNVNGEAVASVSITVTSVNASPVAEADSARTKPNVETQIFVLKNDSDIDRDPLFLSEIVAGPTSGSAFFALGDDVITYTPDESFEGEDQFEYQVQDGFGGQANAIVTVTVTSANAAPIANADNGRGHVNEPAQIFVLDNDSDPDGDLLNIINVSQPANGVASIESDVIGYSANTDFEGDDSFSYTVSDGQGGENTAAITITVSSVNAQPIAELDFAFTQANAAIDVFVLDNDRDPEADFLAVEEVIQPANGTVTIHSSGSYVTYTPQTDFVGEDRFYYQINDGFGGLADAPVYVVVEPPNNPPVAVNDTATTNESEPVDILVLDNDSDQDGDPIFVVSVDQPTNGVVEIDQGGGFISYTPNTGFTGEEQFDYFIDDGVGGQASATVTVTVEPAA